MRAGHRTFCRMAASAASQLASPMPSTLLIDLRVGHPATANLPHAVIADACRRAATRLGAQVSTTQPEHHTGTSSVSASGGSSNASDASMSTDASTPFALNYADNAGTPRFLYELRQWLSVAYGSPVRADCLVTTNGVSHGIDLVCGALTSPGDLVLLEEPCYFLAKHIFRGRHLRIAAAPTDAYGIDTKTLADELESGAREIPKLVYLVPSHANPSGTVLPVDRREQLVNLASKHGFTILSDDVYHLLEWGSDGHRPVPRMIELDPWWKDNSEIASCTSSDLPDAHDSAGTPCAVTGNVSGSAAGASAVDVYAAEPLTPTQSAGKERSVSDGHVVSVGSFTKILSPGMRLGWIEAAPALAQRIAQDGVLVSGGGAAAFASEVVAEVLASGQQDAFLSQLRVAYRDGCDAICDALDTAKCFRFHRPQGGYFVWVQLPHGVTSDALLPLAMTRGVTFLPGSRCAVGDGGGTACDQYVRLCFAYEPVARIVKGVELLADAVAEAQLALTPP